MLPLDDAMATQRSRLGRVFSLGIAAALIGHGAPAQACVWDGSMELEMATDALERGDYVDAVDTAMNDDYVTAALPASRFKDIAFSLQKVAALAVVRSHGRVFAVRPRKMTIAERVGMNLAWAQLVLTYRVAMGYDDPRDRLALAEALAADPYQRGRAREILRALADADVMPDRRGTELLRRLDGALAAAAPAGEPAGRGLVPSHAP